MVDGYQPIKQNIQPESYDDIVGQYLNKYTNLTGQGGDPSFQPNTVAPQQAAAPQAVAAPNLRAQALFDLLGLNTQAATATGGNLPYDVRFGGNSLGAAATNAGHQYGTPEWSAAYNQAQQSMADQFGIDKSRISSDQSGTYVINQSGKSAKSLENFARTHEANQARIAANPEAYAGAPAGGFLPGGRRIASPAELRAAGVNYQSEYDQKFGG